MEKNEENDIKNKCRSAKTKEKKKNYKMKIITNAAASGMYLFGLSKGGHSSGSLCAQTNLHQISFLENYHSSCYIKLTKSNITECEGLKEAVKNVFVSFHFWIVLWDNVLI